MLIKTIHKYFLFLASYQNVQLAQNYDTLLPYR